MSRDDSMLYTGATSASFSSQTVNKLSKQRQEGSERRKDISQKLKPAAEIIDTIIAREKALITDELAALPLNAATSQENVKEVLMAYQRNLQFINRFSNSIHTALRKENI